MYKGYGDYRSGNCYKVKLMLHLLGLPYEWIAIDILKGETQSEAFLAMNPNGKIPVLEWQFFEQYSHEPYVAVARFIQLYQGLPEARRAEYEECHVRGHKALKVMEQQLQRTPYLVGEHFSIADIALYAYTHVADEGGFDLSGYPAICSWLQRVASHPRYVGMLD